MKWRRRTGTGRAPEDHGVSGRELAGAAPAVSPLDERIGAANVDVPVGVVALEHPDELIPYIDVEAAELAGYDWTVGLYDEVRHA